MKSFIANKHFINKITELSKFGITLVFICFLVVKAPTQIAPIINLAAALVLGSAKIPAKLGM